MRGPSRGNKAAPPSKRKASPEERAALDELRALYARVDSALDGFGCDASTDCCRFGVTGREPYPTAVELAELERAIRARGGLPKRRSLPIVRGERGVRDDRGERTCALLDDAGRCLVYASRPFGCRTFFCSRAVGPAGESSPSLPRQIITEIGREIAALSARFAPLDPGPRPITRVSGEWEARRSR